MSDKERILGIVSGLETGRMVSTMNVHRAYWTMVVTERRILFVRERWHLSLPIGTILLGGVLGRLTETAAQSASIFDEIGRNASEDAINDLIKGLSHLSFAWSRDDAEIQQGADRDPWQLKVEGGIIHFRGVRGLSDCILRVTDLESGKTVAFRNMSPDRAIFEIREKIPEWLNESGPIRFGASPPADDPLGWRSGVLPTIYRQLTSTALGWLLLLLAMAIPIAAVVNQVRQSKNEREQLAAKQARVKPFVVAGIEVLVERPQYLGSETEKIVHSGADEVQVTAVTGSRLYAALRTDGRQDEFPTVLGNDVDWVGVDQTSGSGQILEQPGQFQWTVRLSDAEENPDSFSNEIQLRVIVVEDKEPNVTLKPPPAQMSADDSLVLDLMAQDDFGLSEVFLEFSVDDGGRTQIFLWSAPDNFIVGKGNSAIHEINRQTVKTGELVTEVKLQLALEPIVLLEGEDQLTINVAAVDLKSDRSVVRGNEHTVRIRK